MAKLSANLGLRGPELSLCEYSGAAAKAGFDAVECHGPYAVPSSQVAIILQAVNLPMLGLNTRLGEQSDDFGLAAVLGREAQVRSYIDEAVLYAQSIGCCNVHVMAGKTNGSQRAEAVYQANLAYACDLAAPYGITVLIEPINHRDVPGYHLSTVEAAIATIDAVGKPNLKLMFDCYHTQIMQGDVCRRLHMSLNYIGHIQIAAVPDRSEPNNGELDYTYIINALDTMGYDGFIGAEYRPRESTESGLSWMNTVQRNAEPDRLLDDRNQDSR